MTNASGIPKTGDIVLVDFEAWTDTGELFDTTRPKVAEGAGWGEGTDKLVPMPVLLGGQRVVPGFEEALARTEVGQEGEVTVPPEKAFGRPDPAQSRYFPMKDFEKREIVPEVGSQIEVSNRRGTITQVTASRVRVDFNHPMAGRTLKYKFTVVEKVTGQAERVRALIAIDYSIMRSTEFKVEVAGKKATVRVPESASFDTRWFLARHRLGHDLFEHTDLEAVDFVEEMTKAQMEAHGHAQGEGEGGREREGARGRGAEGEGTDDADDGLAEEERL